MRQMVFLLLVFSCVLTGQERFTTRTLTPQGWVTQEYWAGEIIAKPKAYAGVSAKSETRSALADAQVDALGYAYIPHTGDVGSLKARASAISASPDFEWASLSPVVKTRQAPLTNDPILPFQWYLGSFLEAGADWRPSTKRPDNIYFASVDTGACFGHEDFDWSRNETKLNFHAILAPKSPDAQPFDDNGHGCSTSSIPLAKTNNRLGIAGMADFARFGYIKVLDSKGLGKTKDIVSGILELATRVKDLPSGSRVVSLLAFGSAEKVVPIEEAIQIARKTGIIFVASAGNEGYDADRFEQTPTTTPGVISVGAVDTNGQLVQRTFWSSTFGSRTVTLAAPGIELPVAVPKPTESSNFEIADPTGYKRMEGTSYSAAIVAGAALQLLAQKSDMSEEELKIRLMNGNRKVQPVTIWKRTYQGTDLFVSGSSLYLPTALADDNSAPAQPVLEVTPGHSSARIRLSGTEKPFGVRCAYGNIGDQQTLELLPFFGGDEIILKNQDGTPLPSATDLQVACKTVDGAGNWSSLSRAVSFRTKESKIDPVSLNLFSASLGPLGDLIAEVDPNTRPIWNPKEFPLLGQMTWYAGTPQLNYRVGDNDSVLVSEPITLPQGSVSINLKQFVQMIGTRSQGLHFDSSELSVLWEEDGQERQKVLRQIMPNSKDFGLEDFGLDVTEFAGKTVRLSFRLFTNGSSVGIGWILGSVEVRSDK